MAKLNANEAAFKLLTGQALSSAESAELRASLVVDLSRTTKILTEDVAANSTTPVALSDLTFAVEAGEIYKVDFSFLLSASTNLPHQIRMSYPSGSAAFGDLVGFYRYVDQLPAPGSTTVELRTSTAGAASGGAHSGYAVLRPPSSGTVIFDLYQYSAGSDTVTALAGSWVSATKL